MLQRLVFGRTWLAVTAQEVGAPNVYASRVYGVNQGAGVDLSPGAHIATGQELDVAIAGEGFLTVIDESGREAYSRDGRLQVDSLGRLLDSRGQQVMGVGGTYIHSPI